MFDSAHEIAGGVIFLDVCIGSGAACRDRPVMFRFSNMPCWLDRPSSARSGRYEFDFDKPSSPGKMQSSTCRLELTVHGIASGQDEIVVPSVADVRIFVAKSLVPDSVLIVTHLQHDVDYGNFVIFLNAIGSAYVRVLEHRGFYATEPQGTKTGRMVQFVDDDGTFDVNENSAIPRATAVEALNHWLATGKRSSAMC